LVLRVQTIDKSRVSTTIVEQLVEGIRSGGLTPGTALPAERALAQDFGVSRGSVREAIRILEHVGVLEVHTGRGTYVAEAGASKAALLRAEAAVEGDESPLDVLVARKAIEPVCAEHAAAQRSPADLRLLRQNLKEHKEALSEVADPADIDMSFHLLVAAASRNTVLVLLLERLVDIMRHRLWQDLKRRSVTTHAGRGELYFSQHLSVLNAIEARDFSEARARMHSHLISVEEGIVSQFDLEGQSLVRSSARSD
jgi:GntR family transcriptional regulator, transcriptional repressor for pyruvate dehydrogenase complex